MTLKYGDEFESFWKSYPRRVAKIKAFKAYNKAIKEGIDHAAIVEGVRKYAEYVAGKEPEYIAHPASWLNAGRWDDEYSPRPSGKATDGRRTYADSLADAASTVINYNREKTANSA